MQTKKVVAMLLAGGQGSRLGGLTRNIAKPAVSFGGKFRIIDFSLSNCVNSKIDTVGVLTQYKPLLLNSYIGIGTAWDLDGFFGGVHILPPFMGEEGGNWYQGTANAIYHNLDFISYYDPEYVLIISGDHIYKMDYTIMLDFHEKKGADLTISVIEVPWEEASRFGIMTVGPDERIIRFAEKPKNPESNLASMGIYVFSWKVLKQALIEDWQNERSEHDFGKNVIPMLHEQGKKLYGYRFEGYWKDVGTIESYYDANMDLLSEGPELDIFDRDLRIFSNSPVSIPHYIGAKASVVNSLVSNGCTVLGKVINSILAPGVFVGEGSKVVDSIILPNVHVGDNVKIRKAIVVEDVRVGADCVVNTKEGLRNMPTTITVVEDNTMAIEHTVSDRALA
ncbi:MAG TPA: glucose-1-phosphate adenylyltransferase [Clostridia bacterium]|nr:glucose-1-phosphate adenylyltransferase [Clostridia bacterium]